MSIFSRLKLKKASPTQINVDHAQKDAEEIPRQSASSPRKSALLLKQAWVTERAGDLTKDGKYVFIVDARATKPEIKKAIESVYNVSVSNVNVINTKGKTKRLKRSMGRTSAARKAIVTLKKGQKIDVMPT